MPSLIDQDMVEFVNTVIANKIAELLAGTNLSIADLLPSADYTGTTALAKLLTVDGIGSGIDFDVFNSFDLSKVLPFRAELGNTENLDSFVTGGIWHQADNASAALARNYPIARAGELTVKQFGSSYVYQEYRTYDNQMVYQRTKYNSTWFGWKRLQDGNRPMFSAHGPGGGAGPKNVILANVRTNFGSMYNASTGVVTIQQAGIYEFHYSGLSQGGSGAIDFYKNGGGVTYSINQQAPNHAMVNVSFLGPAAVGDYFECRIRSGYQEYADGNATVSYNKFWGRLVA